MRRILPLAPGLHQPCDGEPLPPRHWWRATSFQVAFAVTLVMFAGNARAALLAFQFTLPDPLTGQGSYWSGSEPVAFAPFPAVPVSAPVQTSINPGDILQVDLVAPTGKAILYPHHRALQVRRGSRSMLEIPPQSVALALTSRRHQSPRQANR